jgi:hypothetical protein
MVKKKSPPSFTPPRTESQTTGGSQPTGWVYRSEEESAPADVPATADAARAAAPPARKRRTPAAPAAAATRAGAAAGTPPQVTPSARPAEITLPAGAAPFVLGAVAVLLPLAILTRR